VTEPSTPADRATLLLVDDTPANIDVLRGILADGYRLKAATDGRRALEIARADPGPDLILLDVMMPEMDGYEVCSRLKQDAQTADIPIIFVTAMDEVGDETKGFEVGAVDYITKPVSAPIVQARVRAHLNLRNQALHLSGLVDERTLELEETRAEIVDRLGLAAEYKDDDTGTHVVRMAHYTRLIATEHGLAPPVVQTLFKAAPMHDVGKIGIPDAILKKPGKLDADEWAIMQTHTTIGARILGESSHPLLSAAREIAMTHHEKWNGAGYPVGLEGEAIPVSGRITAVADVFDALTSARPYKEAWEVERAVDLIESEAGQHFDPAVVKSFSTVLPAIFEQKARHAGTGAAAP